MTTTNKASTNKTTPTPKNDTRKSPFLFLFLTFSYFIVIGLSLFFILNKVFPSTYWKANDNFVFWDFIMNIFAFNKYTIILLSLIILDFVNYFILKLIGKKCAMFKFKHFDKIFLTLVIISSIITFIYFCNYSQEETVENAQMLSFYVTISIMLYFEYIIVKFETCEKCNTYGSFESSLILDEQIPYEITYAGHYKREESTIRDSRGVKVGTIESYGEYVPGYKETFYKTHKKYKYHCRFCGHDKFKDVTIDKNKH